MLPYVIALIVCDMSSVFRYFHWASLYFCVGRSCSSGAPTCVTASPQNGFCENFYVNLSNSLIRKMSLFFVWKLKKCNFKAKFSSLSFFGCSWRFSLFVITCMYFYTCNRLSRYCSVCYMIISSLVRSQWSRDVIIPPCLIMIPKDVFKMAPVISIESCILSGLRYRVLWQGLWLWLMWSERDLLTSFPRLLHYYAVLCARFY